MLEVIFYPAPLVIELGPSDIFLTLRAALVAFFFDPPVFRKIHWRRRDRRRAFLDLRDYLR